MTSCWIPSATAENICCPLEDLYSNFNSLDLSCFSLNIITLTKKSLSAFSHFFKQYLKLCLFLEHTYFAYINPYINIYLYFIFSINFIIYISCFFITSYEFIWTSLVAQMVKHLSTMWETLLQLYSTITCLLHSIVISSPKIMSYLCLSCSLSSSIFNPALFLLVSAQGLIPICVICFSL